MKVKVMRSNSGYLLKSSLLYLPEKNWLYHFCFALLCKKRVRREYPPNTCNDYKSPIFQDSNAVRGQKPGSPLAHQGLQHTAEGFGDHLRLLGLHPESGQSQVGLNWTKDMSVWNKVLMYKSRDRLSLLVQSTIQCVFLVYFDPKKYTLKPKLTFF